MTAFCAGRVPEGKRIRLINGFPQVIDAFTVLALGAIVIHFILYWLASYPSGEVFEESEQSHIIIRRFAQTVTRSSWVSYARSDATSLSGCRCSSICS